MILTAEKLTYKVGKSIIVEDISFSIPKGAFTCILGANGAGKSTILKLICGLIKASSGNVYIDKVGAGSARPHKNISEYTKKELATKLAYVPQTAPFDFNFTVEDYIMSGRYPHQSPFSGISADDKSVVNEVINRTGLGKLRARDMSTLSGGERQRVMIATALAQQTEILLLDEPSIFLDPKSSLEILSLLRQIHAEGITLVMVTHDINHALLCGTDFMGIKGGRLLFHEKDLTGGGLLEELFESSFHRLEDGGMKLIFPRMQI
jgi:iron complex transport system ATP-binding protein